MGSGPMSSTEATNSFQLLRFFFFFLSLKMIIYLGEFVGGGGGCSGVLG